MKDERKNYKLKLQADEKKLRDALIAGKRELANKIKDKMYERKNDFASKYKKLLYNYKNIYYVHL